MVASFCQDSRLASSLWNMKSNLSTLYWSNQCLYVCIKRWNMFTARKRSLRQGNVFTGFVCSQEGVGFPACITGHMTRGWSASKRGVCLGGWADPPPEIHGIRSTSGRYVSYWNAFLSHRVFSANGYIQRFTVLSFLSYYWKYVTYLILCKHWLFLPPIES